MATKKKTKSRAAKSKVQSVKMAKPVKAPKAPKKVTKPKVKPRVKECSLEDQDLVDHLTDALESAAIADEEERAY